MRTVISFEAVSCNGFFENLSCEIQSGSSTLLITSRVDENTALLRLISGLISPDSGSIRLYGREFGEMSRTEINALRHAINVVPTNGGLVSNLKMWENITLPLLYNCGGVSAEETEKGYAYLQQLNYSGNIMALPAHLTVYEKRITAFVRGALKQADIMIYSNCFEAIPDRHRKNFISVISEYQQAAPERTTLFISTNADAATELPVDAVFSIH